MITNSITFVDVANALGLGENEAQVSLSIPPLTENTLHFRTFCISELIIKRINFAAIEKFKWAEVNRIISGKDLSTVIVLIQFDSSIQPFPLVLPEKAFFGHRDTITVNLRRIERELPDQIESWRIITKNGMRVYQNMNELLYKMRRMINTKENHVSR